MGIKVTHYVAAIQLAIIAILLAATNVSSNDASLIPADPNQVSSWFHENVKPLSQRGGSINSELAQAEAHVKIIKVRKDGQGDFKTITDALNSISSGNRNRVIVSIGAGTYTEKITIARDKPFVTLAGSSKGPTVLQYAGTAKKYGTVYSATLQVDSDFFVASHMTIKNTAPRPNGKMVGAQALAMRIGGDMAAFYNCRFIGFQDTVCDDRGRHFFKDCHIEGTVDFIFGSGRSLYLGTELFVIADNGPTVITAQAKHSKPENSGFSFVHCKVDGNGSGALLGRAWMEMPEVVFSYSTITNVISPAGWSDNNHPERDRNIIFGEYKCTGAGSNHGARAKFSKQLNDNEAKHFITLGYIGGSSWLLPPPSI